MITPSPTNKIDPAQARGTLLQAVPATPTKPAYIKFAVPNTSYELHLVPQGEIGVATGHRLIGTIRVSARRLDLVGSGGRYLEPVMGRPRRIQGTVVRVESGAVVIDAGVPVHCLLTDARQKPEDFQPGQFVTCGVLDSATFTPAPH